MKRGLALLLLVVLISGCNLLGDKPLIRGADKLTLKVTEGVSLVLEVENPKGQFRQNVFSNFVMELENNDLVRLDYANFSSEFIDDGEKATINAHITPLALGKVNLNFLVYYDEGGTRKALPLKVPTQIIGPGMNVDLREKPMFGKIKLDINETKVFHIDIMNSIDTRYPHGRIKILPSYSWIRLKEVEGYDAVLENGALTIETDIPTAKTIPFMINAVPDAIEAGFSIEIIVEYSSDGTEWAEMTRKKIELFAEG